MKYRVWWDDVIHTDYSPQHCNIDNATNEEDAIKQAKKIIGYMPSVHHHLRNFRVEVITGKMEWKEKLESVKLKHVLEKGGFKVIDL